MATPAAFKDFCARLESSIPEIVLEFQRLTDAPPWSNLSDPEWHDHLPPLLSATFEAAICEGGHAARRRTIELSTKHGSTRRRQGFSPEEMLNEYYLLRNATWAFIHTDVEHHDAVRGIIRLDAALSVATLGSLAGFHREDYERVGKWSRIVDDLVQDWEGTSLT